MRLPLIKHMVSLAEEKDVDFLHETVEVLEHIIDAPGIKDEELDVIGELLSNLAGAIDVYAEIEGDRKNYRYRLLPLNLKNCSSLLQSLILDWHSMFLRCFSILIQCNSFLQLLNLGMNKIIIHS